MKYDVSILEKGCEDLGISLNEVQKEQFIRFYEYLIEKNKVMNLTGITELEEVLVKHFLDSLACVKAVDLSKVKTFMDVGTGAGFPGIPLKIAFPHLKVTLLDSLNKRLKFLNCVIEELALEEIVTVHGRAEDFARQKDYRENFDLVVSRAVANLSTLAEYCLPYANIKGKFVSYKSGKVESELEQAKKAVKILGGSMEQDVRFELMDTEAERSLLVIQKVKSTPKQYPRKAGIPAKEPL